MPRATRLLPAALLLAVACSGDGTEPPPPVVSCSGSDATIAPTVLAVGSVSVLSGNAVNCLRLPGDAGASQYLAVVANVNTTPDVTETYDFSVDAASAAALASRISGERSVVGDVTAAPRLHDAHERLMAAARRLDLRAARAARAEATGLASGIRGAIFPGGITPQVGQTADIRVPSLAAGAEPCNDFSTISAQVKFVSRRAVIMQDVASPTNGFSDADFAAIGAEFDDLIYPVDSAYFGTGSDVDANGGRIVILYTPEVNKATPRNSTSLLAGFFWAGDLFPRTGTNSCSQSNGSELFYLLVPDPTAIHSSARTVADVREKTRGTIAHEFEHMLNAGVRLTTADSFEDVWLDEALAHMAEEVVGRAKLGVGDFDELTHTQVADVGNGLKDYNAFFFQNVARFDDWLRNPSGKAPTSEQADTSLAVRGAAWSLLRHAADHFSGNDARSLLRRIAAGPQVGVTNLTGKTGQGFETLITSWLLANYADNLGIPNLAVRYTYRSWHIHDVVRAINSGTYPLAINDVTADATFNNASVRSGGGAYYRIPVPAAGTPAALQLLNGAATTAGFPNGRLLLLRTQ